MAMAVCGGLPERESILFSRGRRGTERDMEKASYSLTQDEEKKKILLLRFRLTKREKERRKGKKWRHFPFCTQMCETVVFSYISFLLYCTLQLHPRSTLSANCHCVFRGGGGGCGGGGGHNSAAVNVDPIRIPPYFQPPPTTSAAAPLTQFSLIPRLELKYFISKFEGRRT